MVNIIVGNADPTSSQLMLGDLNSDGIIDVLDLVGLINSILN